MATPFTSITDTHGPAQHGTIATNFPFEIDSYKVGTSGGIAYGVAVQQGTDDNECVVGVAGDASAPHDVTDFLGIVVADFTREAGSTANIAPENRMADVLVKGDVWLRVATAVAPGDEVTAVDDTGVIDHGTASATNANLPIYVARWMTTAAAGGLARLRLFGVQGG